MSTPSRRMPKPSRSVVFLLLAAALPLAGAAAQKAPTRGGEDWTVTPAQDDKGCFLTRVYPGPGGTTLLLGLDVDGSNRLSLLNSNWSIAAKDRQTLDFRLSNVSFPKHLAIGIAAEGKRGFVTSFGDKFPSLFAASAFLHVFRGKVPVEQLSLAGSGAAIAELRRCVDLHRGKPRSDTEGKPRPGRIPLDPFATDAGRKPRR